MNRGMAVFVSVAAGFFLSVLGDHNLAVAQGPQQAQERAEAPVYQDGDWWQFRVTEYEYVGFRSDAPSGDYEVMFAAGQLKISTIGGTGTASEETTGLAYDELQRMLGVSRNAPQYLEFPLFVGKKWTEQYFSASRGGRTRVLRTADMQVMGIEEVTTQAGTFKAFKIERDVVSGPTSHWKYTYYYSRDTKSVVKCHFDSSVGAGVGGKRDIELIKFGSKK